MSIKDVNTSRVMTARTMIEMEPNYSQVTARLLMDKIRAEALQYLGVGERASQQEMEDLYAKALRAYIEKGIEYAGGEDAAHGATFDNEGIAGCGVTVGLEHPFPLSCVFSGHANT